MTPTQVADLAGYYARIQQNGYLLTEQDARQWSTAVLRQLGLELPRGVRKDLARALPEGLAAPLSRKFYLVHFREKNKPARDFLKQIALMSGNSDAAFAQHPTTAIFHELKAFAGPELSEDVAEALAPELSELWRQS